MMISDTTASISQRTHKHTCLQCGRVIAQGKFDCELDRDHDFQLCDECANNSVSADPQLADSPVNPTIISDAMSKEWANMLGEPEQGTSWIERARGASSPEPAQAAEKKQRAVSAKMKTVTDGRGKEWRMPTAASVTEERAQKAQKGDPVEMAAKKAQPKTKPAPAKKSTEKRTAAPRPASKPKAVAKVPVVKTADGPLTCRYCGKPVTQPSFIKRRDARCGKCFAKRYGKKKVAKASAS